MSTATIAGPTIQLQRRAGRLRSQAASVHPFVADAYHRRAAELDIQAWLEAVWNPPMDTAAQPKGPQPRLRLVQAA